MSTRSLHPLFESLDWVRPIYVDALFAAHPTRGPPSCCLHVGHRPCAHLDACFVCPAGHLDFCGPLQIAAASHVGNRSVDPNTSEHPSRILALAQIAEQFADFQRVDVADLGRGIGTFEKRSAGAVVHILIVDEYNNAVARHENKKVAPPCPGTRAGGEEYGQCTRRDGTRTIPFVKDGEASM